MSYFSFFLKTATEAWTKEMKMKIKQTVILASKTEAINNDKVKKIIINWIVDIVFVSNWIQRQIIICI